jgi:hypothetical protein
MERTTLFFYNNWYRQRASNWTPLLQFVRVRIWGSRDIVPLIINLGTGWT